jgi:copper chaperone CopZ
VSSLIELRDLRHQTMNKMTHHYLIEGMTCDSCAAKVKSALLILPEVLKVDISRNTGEATIEMQNHIQLSELSAAVTSAGRYSISEVGNHRHEMSVTGEGEKSFLKTYKPLLMIAGYILFVTLLSSFTGHHFDWMHWMNNFMAGFFLVFSFFKFLDLKGFAESYSSYDLLAMRWKAYGYIYPFIELSLGVAFLTGWNPLTANYATIIVMGFSSVGVIKSLMAKQTIQCACLGTVFNLPMSTITLVEDGVMVLMSVLNIFLLS